MDWITTWTENLDAAPRKARYPLPARREPRWPGPATALVAGYGLVTAGALIWLTNTLIFGLWYWEMDGGGRDLRAAGRDGPPDFLFPQMTADDLVPLAWRPEFADYLYHLHLPLSRQAKTIMGLQALVSLLTIGLVIARAVNVPH
jgi:hypothetical protein